MSLADDIFSYCAYNHYDMGKQNYTFPVIFVIIGIIASALLLENVGFLTDNPTGALSNSYFVLIFIIAFLCFSAAFLFEHLMNKTKVDWVLFALLSIFCACGLIAIWIFKDISIVEGDSTAILSYDWKEKLRYTAAFVMFVVSLYSIMFLVSKALVTPRRLQLIYVLLMLTCYVAIVYSFIAEIDQYEHIFSGRQYPEIKSLFWNTNMFSGTLLMGIASCMILNVYKKRAISYISIMIFYAELLITCSVISIVIATFVILVYFLFESIWLIKKSIGRSITALAFYILILTALVCLIAVAMDGHMASFSQFVNHVKHEIEVVNYDTFSNRTGIWEAAFGLMKQDPLKMVFGFGFGISRDVIVTWASVHEATIASTHNGFIQIFFNYGIVGCAFYGIFLIGSFYTIIRLFKKHFRFAFIFFIIECIFLAYAFGESVIFFNSNVQGLIIGLFFYMPVFIKYKNEKYQKQIDIIKGVNLSLRTLDDTLVVKAVSCIIISLIVSLIPFLFLDGIINHPDVYNIIIVVLICLGVSLLFFPYLVYLWHQNTTRFSFRLRTILNSIIMLLVLAGGVGFYFLFYPVLMDKYMIYFPILIATIFLVEVVFYSFVKKPSFRAFISTFVSVFKTYLIAILAALICTILLVFVFKESFGFGGGYLKYIIIFALNLLLFYVFAILFMFKDVKAIIDYFEIRNKNSICLSVLIDAASET